MTQESIRLRLALYLGEQQDVRSHSVGAWVANVGLSGVAFLRLGAIQGDLTRLFLAIARRAK